VNLYNLKCGTGDSAVLSRISEGLPITDSSFASRKRRLTLLSWESAGVKWGRRMRGAGSPTAHGPFNVLLLREKLPLIGDSPTAVLQKPNLRLLSFLIVF
jgi:hypothetical protein